MTCTPLRAWLAGACLLVPGAVQAIDCASLRAQIEARIRAGGVSNFTVSIVDAGASAPGRVVGQCDRGSRRIVYRQPGAGEAAPAQAKRRTGDDAILTECRDGRVQVGGRCGR